MPKAFPIIFSFVGLVLLAVAGFVTKDTLDLRAVAVEVPGTVVSLSASTSDGSTTYSPTYSYEVDGTEYRHESSMSTSSPPNVGEVEPLLVDPDDPTEVKPNTFMGQWFLTTIFGALGAVFSAIGLLTLVVMVRARRRAAEAASPGVMVHDDDHSGHDPISGDDEEDRAPANQGPFL